MTNDIRYTTTGVDFKGEFISWEALEAERNKYRFANSVLVKVGFKYGRVSDVYDETIYDQDEWAKIKAALQGTTAYFSDFAGKHSQTDVEFWSNVDLEEITDLDQIIEFHGINGMFNSNLDIIQGGLEQAEENGEIDGDYNKIVIEDED
jgi:hypothetical protein